MVCVGNSTESTWETGLWTCLQRMISASLTRVRRLVSTVGETIPSAGTLNYIQWRKGAKHTRSFIVVCFLIPDALWSDASNSSFPLDLMPGWTKLYFLKTVTTAKDGNQSICGLWRRQHHLWKLGIEYNEYVRRCPPCRKWKPKKFLWNQLILLSEIQLS